MRAQEFISERKKRSKKTRGLGGYFFPGYGYYGGDSGEGGGDGGGGESRHVKEDADGQQVLDYIHGTHHEPLTTQLQQAVLSYPRWELRSVPISSLHIPDQEYDDEEQEPEADPYNRVQVIDPDHAGEYSANFVDRRPIVVDSEGWIIDGNHRAWAAAELLNRPTIRAWVPVKQGVAEGESNDTAISLSKLGKFHPGADTLAEFVPERTTAQYALHPDKWESTFYSLTNKDSDKLKYYGPKKISIPPGTLVGDMAIANKFYRAKTSEEKQQYAELYKASLQPYPVDVSEYRMPELLIPKQGVAENFADGKNPGRKGLAKRSGVNTKASVSSLRKTAKNSSGEKQRMAHWLANMKAGRAKAKKK